MRSPRWASRRCYDYARGGQPHARRRFQKAVAALEDGERAFALRLAAWRRRPHVLLTLRPRRPRGAGGRRLRRHVPRAVRGARALGAVVFDTVDVTDLEVLRDAIREETRVVWLETPTNPMLRIVDVGGGRRGRARVRRAASSSTTRSRRPRCSGRSSWVPTPSSTASRSTSVVTPTWSEAPSSRATPSGSNGSGSWRTRSARCRVRWTPSWPSAG